MTSAVYNRLSRLRRKGEKITLHRIVTEFEDVYGEEIKLRDNKIKMILKDKNLEIEKLNNKIDFINKTGRLILPWS